MAEGGKALAAQGRGLWSDILLPMWQRLASAIPGVAKALLILLIFWIVAVLVGAGVRKGLGLTRLDDRAVEDWGLGGMLETSEGKARSLEGTAGSLVKWFILLFGFVAFFQALDLAMVAGPLQGIVAEIVGVVPNLLQAGLILLVYWIVASLLRLGVSRGLGAVGFDDKAARFIPEREVKGETVRPSGLVGKLVFYVVLLFGLPPFLDALGQRALVAPLGGDAREDAGVSPERGGGGSDLLPRPHHRDDRSRDRDQLPGRRRRRRGSQAIGTGRVGREAEDLGDCRFCQLLLHHRSSDRRGGRQPRHSCRLRTGDGNPGDSAGGRPVALRGRYRHGRRLLPGADRLANRRVVSRGRRLRPFAREARVGFPALGLPEGEALGRCRPAS